MSKNLAPGLSGLERIKRASVLFAAKGVTKGSSGSRKRGNIHMLIVGEAGLGKSALGDKLRDRLFNVRVADGRSTSGAGMVATVSKNQYSGKWELEAGEIVLANNGTIIIDEAEKMRKSDMQAIHRPMEQGTVTISKAGVHAELNANTSIFAIANPKTGMFDNVVPIVKQIDFPPTLMSRFDLIFILKDNPNEDEDSAKARRILSEHSGNLVEELTPDFMKKYFLYCSKLKPILSEEASEKIIKIYTDLRNLSIRNGERVGMPINTRHLEGLIRLSEAHAKIRLSKAVELEDVDVAEELFLSSLEDFGFEKESSYIDLSQITTNVKSSKKEKYYAVLEIIKDQSEKNGSNLNKSEIINLLSKATKMSDSEVEEILELLYQEGELYKPNSNTYKLAK